MSAPQRTSLLQKVLWHNHETSWLANEDIQGPTKDNELLIESTASLVSLGTERLVISEKLLPDAEQRMRVPYMQGTFADSFTYGYSLVGTVLGGSDELVGKRVHVLHPHHPLATVKKNDVYVLPDTLDTDKATLISNMETAVNAVWDAKPSIGDTFVIQGFGVIGALIAELVSNIPGTTTTIIEPDDTRAECAKARGLSVVHSPKVLSEEVDIAFNTSAAENSLQSAIDCTRLEGLTVELSWYGSRTTTLQLGGGFHYDRKRIIASQVSLIPTSKQSFWNYRRRKQLVCTLLQSMDTKNILTRHIQYDDTPEFFRQLRDQPCPDLGVVIHYKR